MATKSPPAVAPPGTEDSAVVSFRIACTNPAGHKYLLLGSPESLESGSCDLATAVVLKQVSALQQPAAQAARH